MTDRPVIFSAPMVLALLAGRKTMTRRLAYDDKGRPTVWLKMWWDFNFRPILNHPDYAAGRDGVVYRIEAPFKVRPLKSCQTSKYPNISLSTGGAVATKNVHRLICEAWYGPPPSERHEVRHLDSNRKNSTVDNLDWSLPEGNWSDRNALGRGVREEHHAAKLSLGQVAEIRLSRDPQRELAKRYGVSQSTIGSARTGETWAKPAAPAGLTMPRPARPKLWVREGWKPHSLYDAMKPRDMPPSKIFYLADEAYSPSGSRGRPSIHMPRAFSRLTLVVTATKIERLQKITNADVRAEGVPQAAIDKWGKWLHPNDCPGKAFGEIWDALHGAGAWDENPEVVALSFTVHKQNIDALAKEAA